MKLLLFFFALNAQSLFAGELLNLRQNVVQYGEPVAEGSPEAGAMAVILKDLKDDQVNLCSAVFLSDRILLTAAHCLPQGDGKKVYIFPWLKYGLTMASLMESERYSSSVFRAHPSFDPSKSSALETEGDLALVLLPKASPHARPVKLPDENASIPDGQDLLILGSGLTALDREDSALHAGRVKFKRFAKKDQATAPDKKFFYEIATKNQTICQGDSGGPALIPEGNGFVVVGIHSGGNGCLWWRPSSWTQSVSTFIPPYVNWIRTTAKQLEAEQEI